jgi:hypothetical protein
VVQRSSGSLGFTGAVMVFMLSAPPGDSGAQFITLNPKEVKSGVGQEYLFKAHGFEKPE